MRNAILVTLALSLLTACGSQNDKDIRRADITSCLLLHGTLPYPKSTPNELAAWLAEPAIAGCLEGAFSRNPAEK